MYAGNCAININEGVMICILIVAPFFEQWRGESIGDVPLIMSNLLLEWIYFLLFCEICLE